MKKNYFLLLIVLAIIATTINVKAQKNEKSSKQVTIKIVTEEDGKTTVIDTTFTTADEATVETFLRDKGISNSTNPPLPPNPPSPPSSGNQKDKSVQERKYEYSYKKDDNGNQDEIHISIDMDKIEKALEEADRQLEQAFNKSASLTKEEIRKIKKEVETSLKEIKSDLKANKKYIIIETTKKKSSESENKSK